MNEIHSIKNIEPPYYFVPNSSAQPIRMSVSILGIGLGASGWVNNFVLGKWITIFSFICLLIVLYLWFHESILESQKGLYGSRIDMSYRWGMGWFIFSEIMFFFGFFGALWYIRNITIPWLGDLDHKIILWPNFQAVWPNSGPGNIVDQFEIVNAFWLPTINTALLLTSGLTITISHNFLRKNNCKQSSFWLAITIIFGISFIIFQILEYMHAYSELNLKFNSGIYGSLFYMLTGFHGFHVIIGTIMLTVVFIRLMKEHLTQNKHFVFEAVAWYWHFVDVIWLGLYLFVYWF
ncbi:MAG: cytochrome c oxidase subunit 3 [Bordetella sp.]|nr:MAG: cytochrome c oxidase subunit 3 [Bordetella sp.]